MDQELGAALRARLEHALSRLNSEPRRDDRRANDRRMCAMPIPAEFGERRSGSDRRAGDRRTMRPLFTAG